MFWKKWPYWSNIRTSTTDTKLKLIDFVVIVSMSTILSVLTFFLVRGSFYYLAEGNWWVKFTGNILLVSYLVGLYPIYFLIKSPRDPEGSSLGSAIYASLLSPVVAVVLWFLVFYFIAKISAKLLNRNDFFSKHSLSFAIFVFIASPYVYFMIGSNAVSACLSGDLNSVYTTSNGAEILVGPDSCFESITEKKLGYSTPDAQNSLNYCVGLSDVKIASSSGFYIRGSVISHQDYCLLSLSPLPPKELCDLAFKDDNVEKNKCAGYYSWLNRPRDNQNLSTTTIKLSSVQSLGTATYDERNNEIMLVKEGEEIGHVLLFGYVPAPSGANYIEFDGKLVFENSTRETFALLSIFMNEDLVGFVDGRSYSDGKFHFWFEFPAFFPGEQVLGFRLDTFSEGVAKITLSNIALGFRDYPGVFNVPHNIIRP